MLIKYLINVFIILAKITRILCNDFYDIELSREYRAKPAQDLKNDVSSVVSAKLYTKIFERRRMEQHSNIRQRIKAPYEKNYKLLKVTYEQLFQVLKDSNETLLISNYTPTKGFPQQNKLLQEAVIHILENCCLAAENVLHFPEISYRIFRNINIWNWKGKFNWCMDFVNGFPHITNEPTVKLMDLFKQEINEELRENNYFNPYYSKRYTKAPKVNKTKMKKKIKKGPQLSGGIEKIEL